MPFSFFHLCSLSGLPCLHAVAPLCTVPVNVIAVLGFGGSLREEQIVELFGLRINGHVLRQLGVFLLRLL
jgi:hypothetical protein